MFGEYASSGVSDEKSSRSSPPSCAAWPHCQWEVVPVFAQSQPINETFGLILRQLHVSYRAARGRWKAFECGKQQCAHGKQGLQAVLFCRACCSSVRGRPGHHAASKTSSSSSNFVYSIDLAVRLSRWPSQSRRMGRRQAQKPGRAGPDPHAWKGLSWPSCTDFFGLFMFMS